MIWFRTWWESLGIAGQIMACAAIPATIVMLIQLILTLSGAQLDGEGDLDGDVEFSDYDDITDAETTAAENCEDTSGFGESAVRLLTVRGITAFFAIGGWAGLAALTSGVKLLWSIQIALLSGAGAMLLASAAIKLALKMQSDGTLDLRNAISQEANVYITIPPKRSKTGRITLLLQDRFTELEAVTDSETPLKTNTRVEVIGLADRNCVIVRPVEVESANHPVSPQTNIY